MTDSHTSYPDCFGILDSVFPMAGDGLRKTPKACYSCEFKTACLRDALKGCDGLVVQEERIDRAYASGRMTFIERWSQKKAIQRRKKERGRIS